MQFLRVWRGLSAGQRGYMFMFILGAWLMATDAVGEIGRSTDSPMHFGIAGGFAAFAIVLYFSVRRAALAADSEGHETGHELYGMETGRPIAQMSGSPKRVVVFIGITAAFTTMMIMGQNGWAGLVALVIVCATTRHLHRCAKQLAQTDKRYS